MKRAFLIHLVSAALCLSFGMTIAQSIQPHAYVSGGLWAPNLRYDARTTLTRSRMAVVEVGGGLTVPMGKVLAFTPELGLSCWDMNYAFSEIANPHQMASDLVLFYLRASPGLTLFQHSRVLLRFSPTVLGLAGGLGSYELTTFVSSIGTITELDLHRGFSKYMRPVNFGPELSLGYRWPLGKDKALAIRGTAFHTILPLMRYNVHTPTNPYLRKVALEALFYFGK